MSAPRLPTAVVIGRPNVGKSTLFNRLLERRRALVHDMPGVTRDRIEEIVDGRFRLIDTGGLGGELFAEEIERQVGIALEEADVVIWVLDRQMGIHPKDRDILRSLKRSGIEARGVKILGAVNKVDDEAHTDDVHEFMELGLDALYPVSAEHGRGFTDLRAGIEEALELSDAPVTKTEEETPSAPPRIAIVGRPNVGKSTLLNALARQERVITSPMAGTTVDAVDLQVELQGRPYTLVDTAGIRRKSKTEQGVEVLSVLQARKALERCDVAILVLDGEGGVTDQDEKIGGLIEEIGCSVILLVNKWDTQKKNREFSKEDAAERVRKQMAFLKYAPIVFASALKREGLDPLADLVDEILSQRSLKLGTHEFTEWIREQSEVHNPANVKFYLCHQSGRHPPTFVCHVNNPDKVHYSLKRNLMNALRERWGFMGSPIRLLFVEGKNRKSLPKGRAGKKKSATNKNRATSRPSTR